MVARQPGQGLFEQQDLPPDAAFRQRGHGL
jgi:hypothetical protein